MKNCKSIITAILITLIYCYSAWVYKPYKTLYYQIGGDSFGYYIYLPSFFIHHDLSDLKATLLAKYRRNDPGKIKNNEAPQLGVEPRGPRGNTIIKYTMGVAVMQAPFFLIAHFLAGILHDKQDGFSMIYMEALQISVIFYVLMGFLILIMILKNLFSDTVIALVITAVGLATNLYYLVCMNAPLSHPYLFFVYALLIYATISYYTTFLLRFLLLIGFCVGMIVLIRANEAYALLIPLLWGLVDRVSFIDRIRLVKNNLFSFIGAGLISFICIVPQLVYWKIASGSYIYYSYGTEKFDFLHPEIIRGLFGFGNGWLSYSPLMFLALIGIYRVAKRHNPSFVPLIIFLPLHIYIIYSWWCWFYMGSYGSRPMTETYPLLSIPLAYSIEWFWQSLIKKMVLVFLIGFFSAVVIFNTYQTSIDIFCSEIENWQSILAAFGKTRLSYKDIVILDTDESQPENLTFIKTLYTADFEDSTLSGSSLRFFRSGTRSLCIGKGQFSPSFGKTLKEIGAKPGQWIKACVSCYSEENPQSLWAHSSLIIESTLNKKAGKWKAIRLQNKIDSTKHEIWYSAANMWGRPYFYSRLPIDMKEDDKVAVYVWNASGPDIYIDDLKVELYIEK